MWANFNGIGCEHFDAIIHLNVMTLASDKTMSRLNALIDAMIDDDAYIDVLAV